MSLSEQDTERLAQIVSLLDATATEVLKICAGIGREKSQTRLIMVLTAAINKMEVAASDLEFITKAVAPHDGTNEKPPRLAPGTALPSTQKAEVTR